METFISEPDKYLNVTERYFTQKYYKNEKVKGEDLCILVHSNKICVICLAETHPIIKDKKVVVSVDYQFDNVNRLCNRVSGKSKKGGQNLTTDALLCKVLCEDGSMFYIPCGLKCQLLETNDSLKNSPSTLTEKHLSDGFIAIVMPKLKEFPGEMNQLMPKEEFFAENKTLWSLFIRDNGKCIISHGYTDDSAQIYGEYCPGLKTIMPNLKDEPI